jgi:hypothetical protein
VEEKTITKALSQCGYPQWTIDKVKKDRQTKADNPKKRKDTKSDPVTRSLATVTLPYIKGATEHVLRILKKHNVASAVKPHRKLRSFLVHPKDKISVDNTSNCVYKELQENLRGRNRPLISDEEGRTQRRTCDSERQKVHQIQQKRL